MPNGAFREKSKRKHKYSPKVIDFCLCGTIPPRPFRLWTLPVDSLRMHPHIRDYRTAKAIVLYRENNPASALTVEGLAEAGIIDRETAMKLSRCIIR